MNTLLVFSIMFLISYATGCPVSAIFTFLGRSGSKRFFMSNTNIKSSYADASNTCKFNNMALARLETVKEYADLITMFDSSVQLPDRAFVGISLNGRQVIDNESKNIIPYSISWKPGNPSGDGTCLEVLRQGGSTGINDLACSAIRNFICEEKDDLSSLVKFHRICDVFAVLGRSGSKMFFMSDTNVKMSYADASNICKSNNMVLARLETIKEHADLITMFDSSVQLPDRAFVGISLNGRQVIDNESKNIIPYSISWKPGNPSGDGTCLEVLRQGGSTGINDLACSAIRNFICEKKTPQRQHNLIANSTNIPVGLINEKVPKTS